MSNVLVIGAGGVGSVSSFSRSHLPLAASSNVMKLLPLLISEQALRLRQQSWMQMM